MRKKKKKRAWVNLEQRNRVSVDERRYRVGII